jgi:two-component system phosphate regulon sensor histidine kinase PhoR
MPPSFTSFLAAVILLFCGALAAWMLGTPTAGIAVFLASGVGAVLAATLGRPDSRKAEPIAQNMPVLQGLPLHLHPGFDDLFDALPSPFMTVNVMNIVAANRAAKELLGSFIIGADVRAAIRHPAVADRLDNPKAQASAEAIDLTGIGHPGERWEMQTMPMADGSVLVALANQTSRDAVERMRADFVANASHELRTPLAAIIGYVETLRDAGAGDDAELRQRFLSIVDVEARRMLQLIADLMSISRIEASKGDGPSEEIDLAQCARIVIDELVAGGDPRAKAVTLSASSALVRGDRAQLSQLVNNIVSNAMKYGREGTPIMVAIATANAMAELTVADQGDGISSEHLPRLTERFYRVDSARSRALGGTGLGLAIVKHVVNRHRGRLDIDSVVGTGTTVRVRLPLVNP